jgi:signal transduction histidine kinase
MANAKLQLLSSITRHDILNQVLVVNSYCELTEMIVPDNLKALDYLKHITKASENIQNTINFTKDYEELGLNAPVWQDVEKTAQVAAADLATDKIHFVMNTGNVEIFADPMLMRVFFNLFQNASHHGGHVTEIAIHFTKKEKSGTLTIEDNGIGVPAPLKERIFERGFGENSGFGLFLIREILAITGLSITETGPERKGARFEIFLPPGTWRRGPG